MTVPFTPDAERDFLRARVALLEGLLRDCRPYLVALASRLDDCPLRSGCHQTWNRIDATLQTRGTIAGDAARHGE
jgi:hypothetical protein